MTTLPSSIRSARARMAATVAAAGGIMPPLPAQVVGDGTPSAPPVASAPSAVPPVPSAPPAAPPVPPTAPVSPAASAPPVPPVPPAASAPPIAPAVEPAPAPAPAPAAAPDPTVQALLRQNQQLLDRLAEVRSAEPPAPSEPAPDPDFVPRIEKLTVTPAEKATFHEAENYVRALAREEVMNALNQLLPEFNAVRKRAAKIEKELDTRVGTVAKQTFEQALRAAVPDFDTLVNDARFNAYLDAPLPYQPSRTLRHLMSDAYRAQDIATIRVNVENFRRQASATAAPTYAAPDPSALVHPVIAGGGQPAVPTGAAPQTILTASQRAADFHQYRTGKMPHDQWMLRQAEYDKAMIEGRFDPNK